MMDITYSNFTDLEPIERRRAVEAMLFASSEPLSAGNLAEIFSFNAEKAVSIHKVAENQSTLSLPGGESLPEPGDYFARIIDEINEELSESGRPYEIIESGGGYVFATKREYGQVLQLTSKYKFKKKLSQAALETLAIIAWKQPVCKPEIEQIRGINSSEIVNSLLDKDLITISGKKELPGRPLAYSTSQKFLQTFGLNSINELPKLREIDEILASDAADSESTNVTLEVPDRIQSEQQPNQNTTLPQDTKEDEQ